MANKYNPYDESTYNPTQKALSRPLTAPSFNPNSSITQIPTAGDASMVQSAQTQVAGAPQAAVQGAPAAPVAAVPVAVAPVNVAQAAAVPGQQSAADADLAKWGYTGAIPINNVEQQAIDFTNNMYKTGGALGTLNNAQDYYNQVLAGKYGPEGQAYLQQVLNPMRASSMQNYNDMSKALATKFSDVGGYYGGRSGIAQGKLAATSANDMAQQEANLRYQGFSDNQSRMGSAAQGLTGLAQTQGGLSGDMLNYLLSTGGMITGRDETNRAQYQQAMQNSYNDWLRARTESLQPFSWAQNLTSQPAVTPVVTNTPGVDWGTALSTAGGIAAAFI